MLARPNAGNEWKVTAQRRMNITDDVAGPLLPPSPTGAQDHLPADFSVKHSRDDFLSRLQEAEKRDDQKLPPSSVRRRSSEAAPEDRVSYDEVDWLVRVAVAAGHSMDDLEASTPRERLSKLRAWAR